MVNYLIGKLGSTWRLLGISHSQDPPASEIMRMKEAGYSNVIWTNQIQSFYISKRKKR